MTVKNRIPLTPADGLLVLMVLAWGVNFTVIKAALREFYPMVFNFNVLRLAVASFLIITLLWWKERDIKIHRPDL